MRHCFCASVERARAGDPTCWIGVRQLIVRRAVTMMLHMAAARRRDRSRRRATTTRPSQMAAGDFSKPGRATPPPERPRSSSIMATSLQPSCSLSLAACVASSWARALTSMRSVRPARAKAGSPASLGNKACRDDRSVLYHPRLLVALALARGDGRCVRLLKSLAPVELLILDDWGLAPLTSQQGRDLLERSSFL
jgi:hypothetical protein